jgi:serine/threonine protein kinase/tetratricopeptide (TPR) repeat protein
MPIAAGTRFGRYEIRSMIGAGGMGEVYLSHDTKLDRAVALKILPPDVAAVHNRMSRFVQEAKAASSLNHPNILTVYEIDETDSGHFIATEFIDGDTLRDVMRSGPMTLSDALDIATQVAGALAAAHAAGIVHRDIKPENIMRRRDGVVKVLDFGLAKLSEAGGTAGEIPLETQMPTAAPVVTEPGVVMGSTLYMSPEQARGRPVDARTDIFSLGVVLYEMVGHRQPFSGSNTNEIVASLLGDKEPTPLARYAAAVPVELERIVSKALRKDRDERYQTVKDLLLDLRSVKQALEFDRHASASSLPVHEQPSAAVSAPQPHAGRPLARGIAVVCVLSLVIAATAYWRFVRPASHTSSIDSVAVMPFENQTHDQQVEYLSDGVTESLINSLSRLSHIRVSARNSVFSYKNQAAQPRQVAQQLNVRAIVTGRVLMRGDMLDVRVELTDTQNNVQLWGDHYTRKAADIFVMQDDIARQVADALRVHLAGGEQEQIAKRYTENPEAYRLYLQGRYFFNGGSEEDMNRAVAFFDRAIALDPRYGLAYAARGETYFTMGDLSLPMKEAMPRAKKDVTTALGLDDTLGGARMVLANIRFQYDWNFAGADDDFQRVISMNPNDAEARHQYTYLLAMTGRPMEAVAQIQRAQQLDPVNPWITTDVQLPYFLSRQYEESIAAGRKALDMFPNLFVTHMALGGSLFEKGDVAAGIQELEKAKALEPTPLVLGNLGYAYAKVGRKTDARKLLADLADQSRTRHVASYWSAVIHAGMNEKDDAFALLEKAYEERSWWLVWTKTDPKVDTLRSDSRFTDLMRRVGFPQ